MKTTLQAWILALWLWFSSQLDAQSTAHGQQTTETSHRISQNFQGAFVNPQTPESHHIVRFDNDSSLSWSEEEKTLAALQEEMHRMAGIVIRCEEAIKLLTQNWSKLTEMQRANPDIVNSERFQEELSAIQDNLDNKRQEKDRAEANLTRLQEERTKRTDTTTWQEAFPTDKASQ